MDEHAYTVLEHLVREAYAHLSAEIAIYGTGELGRLVAARLVEAGGCVTFTDSNAESWGGVIDDVAVLPPAEAVSRAGAVVIASVAHASRLSSQVRRLRNPKQTAIVCWVDQDGLPVVDDALSPSGCGTILHHLLRRCLALIDEEAMTRLSIVVLPDLAVVAESVREQWPAARFTTPVVAAAESLDRLTSQTPLWIVGDTSPEGCRLAVDLSNRGHEVRSPFPIAVYRGLVDWYSSSIAASALRPATESSGHQRAPASSLAS